MRKPIFPIPFEVIRKHKYLYFILGDIFMGVFTWLTNKLLLTPEPLFTTSSYLSLFISLWIFYPAIFYMYEYAKRKHERKLYADNEPTKK
jgi:hypothetical protein